MAKAPAAGAAPPPSPPPPGVPLDLPASHNLLLGADVPVPPLCHRCGEADAVGGLLHRLLPRHAQLFRLKLLPPQDRQSAGYFSVQVLRGAVHLEGSSGVELASGLNWFLK